MWMPASAFSGPYLRSGFRTREGAQVRILERPGRWMGDAELDAVTDGLRSVIGRGVAGGSLDYGVASDRSRLDDAVLTLVYLEGRMVAFSALALLDCELGGRREEVLHLGLALVHPGYRGRGLTRVLYFLTCLLVFLRRQMRPVWISNVTQVPAVFGLVSDGLQNVFPSWRPGTRRSFDHLLLARQIMDRHRRVFGVGPEAGFDEDRFVITNSYTGGSDNLKKSFEEAPPYRIDAVNAMCRRELDYDRGDDFLQLAQFGFRAARTNFARLGSVLSPARLAASSLILMLESLVAPTLQWFAPSAPAGYLRPRAHPGPRRRKRPAP